jgi:hypothetical protein
MSITAMKQALEAWDVYKNASDSQEDAKAYASMAVAFDNLRAACERAERQRPVAWTTDLLFDADTEVIPAKHKGKLGTNVIPVPLYGGPTSQWIGLTDAEIAEWDYDVRDLVMDIEKLLREKNT